MFDRFKKKRKPIDSNTLVGLTPVGSKKSEDMEYGEGVRNDVLGSLAESGPTPIVEISRKINTPYNKVESAVKYFIEIGYVRQISINEGWE